MGDAQKALGLWTRGRRSNVSPFDLDFQPGGVLFLETSKVPTPAPSQGQSAWQTPTDHHGYRGAGLSQCHLCSAAPSPCPNSPLPTHRAFALPVCLTAPQAISCQLLQSSSAATSSRKASGLAPLCPALVLSTTEGAPLRLPQQLPHRAERQGPAQTRSEDTDRGAETPRSRSPCVQVRPAPESRVPPRVQPHLLCTEGTRHLGRKEMHCGVAITHIHHIHRQRHTTRTRKYMHHIFTCRDTHRISYITAQHTHCTQTHTHCMHADTQTHTHTHTRTHTPQPCLWSVSHTEAAPPARSSGTR